MASLNWRNLAALVAAIALQLTGASAAQGVLVEEDLFGTGDGLLTLDTDTGFRWLDLTESTNRSVNDVSSQFGVGGDFEGFRYATIAEAATLYANAGIPNPYLFTEANVPGVTSLLALMGETGCLLGSSATSGACGLASPNGLLVFPNRLYLRLHGNDFPVTAIANQGGFNVAAFAPNPVVGSYLVIAPPCGNGLVAGAETCDDAGTTPGDGCDAVCQIEPGYMCVGAPSVCFVPAVPALSPWSIALLATALMGSASWAARRRRLKHLGSAGVGN